MLLLRALLFYVGLGSSTLLFGPAMLLFYPIPFRTRYYAVTRWTAFNLWWLRATCGLGHSVEGRENIPAGPVVVLCKHQSAFETLALQLLFVPQAWVLKRELLWIPIYGWGLAVMQPIAIDRGSAVKSFRQIVAQGSQRLRDGVSVVVFPEGTRTAPGERGKYLPGGAMLAGKSGFPVVPVAHNAGWFWRRKGLLKYPGEIKMVIGPPIHTDGLSTAEINRRAEEWIENTTAGLPQPRPQRG
ncbi:MAG: lysophospholipid acyltransferase family protein [Pseudomonadales bacterium]|jgi:1-acyl-sn-glycerol-3-phosphate acyltransferase|nr:lysophospholipid acyltransferase family protein [Pseudomonadales bacterium]MDP6472312.1 lysophospholipid acyltransferase family protein [Pseudomonadales bacterium]MDP6828108.1 lysophospholipid acyltransferase family protein [Pseudomonadales bacterium]MDP6971806.1 lysophospholipid acyltransferase family protein [Pseudomonadales bacterium]